MTDLSEWGRGNPSSCQMRVGGGLPLAMHLRDTAGPGWRVTSLNLNRKNGMASGSREKVNRLYRLGEKMESRSG